MTEEIVAYSYDPKNTAVVSSGRNYICDSGNGLPPVTLRRDIDFGVIQGQKKPSLFKAGAEKIATQYGLCQRYELVDKVEQFTENIFFHYVMRCDLVKLIDGKEYVITSSFGSSNTNERRNGRNSPWDAANATLKMAQKRALTGAVLALCSGSSMFTQDIEDEEFMRKAEELKKTGPDDPIDGAQRQSIYATAKTHGISIPEAKKILKEMGFDSVTQVTQKDYDAVKRRMRGEE